MQTNYHDEKGNIRKELLNEDAEKRAREFKASTLTLTQLRKFYNEFKGLEKRVRAKGFDPVLPLIKMVCSRASYASNRKNNKIPESFKDFLIKNVKAINEKRDFDAFLLHFEAVVGFCYGMGLKK
ncbi:MAG: type III-A CRISPR-associated protein Csm2 [Proteobacteria bacterium]|nr:type III-A CRISPR-associated protein Csm2 [Pseudomonadota bacterium]